MEFLFKCRKILGKPIAGCIVGTGQTIYCMRILGKMSYICFIINTATSEMHLLLPDYVCSASRDYLLDS